MRKNFSSITRPNEYIVILFLYDEIAENVDESCIDGILDSTSEESRSSGARDDVSADLWQGRLVIAMIGGNSAHSLHVPAVYSEGNL